MLDVEVVLPIGARTYADLPEKSGTVTNVWLDSAVAEHAEEDRRLKSGTLDPRVSRALHRDILGTLTSLKRRAAVGQLLVGHDETFPVRVVKRVTYLLEMRPMWSQGTRAPRHFRLYYVEPAGLEGSLLPLVLSTKPVSGDPKREQDASIDEAKLRSRHWNFAQLPREV